MIITCPECDTKYRYDERRFEDDATKKVKCTSCGLTFEAANPAIEAPEVKEPTEPGDDGRVEADTGFGADWSPEIAKVDAPAPIEPDEDKPAAIDIDESAPIPPLPSDPRYSLAVIAGGQAGSVFQIHKPRTFLGRGSSMDIQLRDSEVSRRHVVLEIRDPEVSLTNLGATNGTWFNGEQVETTILGHQDEFTVGSTTLMLIVTPVRGIH